MWRPVGFSPAFLRLKGKTVKFPQKINLFISFYFISFKVNDFLIDPTAAVAPLYVSESYFRVLSRRENIPRCLPTDISFISSIKYFIRDYAIFVTDYTRPRRCCVPSVRLKYDNDETIQSSTSRHVTLAATNRFEVRPRGPCSFRGIDARGRPVAVVRIRAVRFVRPGLHRAVRGFGRVRSRDGRLRAGNRLRVHRAHEHARVHTGHADAH